MDLTKVSVQVVLEPVEPVADIAIRQGTHPARGIDRTPPFRLRAPLAIHHPLDRRGSAVVVTL